MELNKTDLGEVKDEHGNTWGVWLHLGGDQPKLEFVNYRAPSAIYNLAQLLPISGSYRRLHITAGELSDPVYTFSALSMAPLVQRALDKIPTIAGQFEARWVPNDPRVPF